MRTVSFSYNVRGKRINGCGYSDMSVTCDGYVLYLSIMIKTSVAKGMLNAFKHHSRINISGFSNLVTIDDMDVFSHNIKEYTHVVFRRKEVPQTDKYIAIFCNKDDINQSNFYSTMEFSQKIIDKIFESIVKNTSTPLLPEWKNYIVKEMANDRVFMTAYVNSDYKTEENVKRFGFQKAILYYVDQNKIENIISTGLQYKKISIDGCYECSDTVKNIGGMDAYQNAFGQVLADKTTNEFKPYFDPKKMKLKKNVSGFFDVCDYYHDSKIISYEKQKQVIQGGAISLNHNKNLVISGQTGSGKTLLAIGTVVTHARKKNYATLVLAPAKLVTRWSDGSKSTVPLAEIHEVSNLDEFIKATKRIKDTNRLRPLWIIMSENTAKITYEERPGVIWNEQKKCYVCPHCGRPIAIKHRHMMNGALIGGERDMPATTFDFLKKDDKNNVCHFVLDSNGKPTTGCGEILWEAATKENSKEWIKIDKVGWVMSKNLLSFKEQINFNLKNISNEATSSYKKLLQRYSNSLEKYTNAGSIERYPHRYSIAKYIRKHLNHCFDYLIADEVQTVSGNSQQGDAFGIITGSVWKSIFLTGTLSNGYASGLFYLLFRTQTRKMIEDGFNYDNEKEFSEKYGVQEDAVINIGHLERTRTGDLGFVKVKTKKTKKELPGISPTIVADYLMNNMVSVSKKDIRSNLCKYSEIPVGVNMDKELHDAYYQVIGDVTTIIATNRGSFNAGSRKAINKALLMANMFLDQPFGIDTVRRDQTEPIELSDSVIRNKEQKLIDIAKEHKDNGEKMLIYVEYTNKLEIAQRLVKLLRDNGISAIHMDNSIKQGERQNWLIRQAQENNIDAVVVNPSLIDVGLNLLDYTTIIFYEISTQVTKIRQASQRSNRINQEHPVTVYFMYYKNTIQEDMLGAISQKLKASKAIEGDFSESALQNMTEDTDILTKLVNSLVKNEHIKVSEDNFEGNTDDETECENNSDCREDDNVLKNSHIKKLSYHDRPKFDFWLPKNSNFAGLDFSA